MTTKVDTGTAATAAPATRSQAGTASAPLPRRHQSTATASAHAANAPASHPVTWGLTARSVAARVSNPTRSVTSSAGEPEPGTTVSGRPVTSASDPPTPVSAVAVRSCSCTTPGCRVEAEVSSPRGYDGPAATTARGRTADTPSPTPATTTSAPASTARTRATSASSCRSAASRAVPDSGRVPPSTSTTGHSNDAGRVGRYVATTPSGAAPPIAAPGPTVSTQAPDAVTPSPRVPGRAS